MQRNDTSNIYYFKRKCQWIVDLQGIVVPAVELHASQEARVLIVQRPGTGATPQAPGVPRTSAYAQDGPLSDALAASTALHYAGRRFRADDQAAGALGTGEIRPSDAAVARSVAARVLDFRLRNRESW